MKALVLILLVLGVGCGRPSEVIPAHIDPSQVQSSCEASSTGVYFHFIYKTCDKLGTACITRSGDTLFFDGKPLEPDSCMSQYLSTQGL